MSRVLVGKLAGKVRLNLSPETVVGRFSTGGVTEIPFADLAAELGALPATSGRLYDCDVSIAVGDPVYFSGADTVAAARADDVDKAAILVVISKPTTTTCRAAAEGKVTRVGGATPGARYWLGQSGGMFTTLPPTGSLIQPIGIGASATEIEIRIGIERVIAP